MKKCKQCGGGFVPVDKIHLRTQIYCARKCRMATYRKKNMVDATCPKCGRAFKADKWTPNDFCSRRCAVSGPPVKPPKLEDAFGHWLAGFVAGEGCFHIQKHAGIAKFLIALREDDLPILRTIQRNIGFGAMRYRKGIGTHRPTYCYTVENWRECIALIPIFERFPLRAKKHREFRIWREALLAWLNHKPKSRIIAIANKLNPLR